MAAEIVALWLSLAAGLTSIVLAIAAIIFATLTDNRNRKLNIEFTKNLTIIEEKSTTTQALMDSMLRQIVNAFIDLQRSSTTPTPTQPEGASPNGDEDQTGTQLQAASNSLLIKLTQDIAEIRLRQRLLPATTPTLGEFAIGQRIHILEDNERAPKNLRGQTGTIIGKSMTGDESIVGAYLGYTIQLDTGTTIARVREEWMTLSL